MIRSKPRWDQLELEATLKNIVKWAEVIGPKADSGEWIALEKARQLLAKLEAENEKD